MTFGPSLSESLARAHADLRMGVPVILVGAEGSLMVLAAETVSDERVQALGTLGDPVVTVSNHRANTLKARAYDGDVARILLPAGAGKAWISAVADPADDLKNPLKGPLKTQRGGNADLHRLGIALAKSARLLPAIVSVPIEDGQAFAKKHDLTHIDALEAAPKMDAKVKLQEIVSARVPLSVSEDARLYVYRPEDGGDEHYAIVIGRPDRNAPVLTRLHSACFTGDLLGSLKCDCGPQLHAALATLGEVGSGVLLYLNQEGRGIGLANKMRAYSLQDQGFDTVEANQRLGFEDDERDFRIGADILRALGFSSARLLTNNPNKMAMLQANGIDVVERVPLKVGRTHHNADYLDTKAGKSGHLL